MGDEVVGDQERKIFQGVESDVERVKCVQRDEDFPWYYGSH